VARLTKYRINFLRVSYVYPAAGHGDMKRAERTAYFIWL